VSFDLPPFYDAQPKARMSGVTDAEVVKKKSTYKKKGRNRTLAGLWYIGSVKKLTITEFARMGGKARAAKLSKERRVSIAREAGKKGGRPRKAQG
jgi:general stress protein YciG